MLRLALASTLVLLLLSGCSGGPYFAAERTAMTVDPGTFAEVNVQMKQGGVIEYSWSTTGGNVHFNIHVHRDGKTLEFNPKDGAVGSGTYTTDLDGGYSLMWENKGTRPVSLTYHVSGPGTLESQV